MTQRTTRADLAAQIQVLVSQNESLRGQVLAQLAFIGRVRRTKRELMADLEQAERLAERWRADLEQAQTANRQLRYQLMQADSVAYSGHQRVAQLEREQRMIVGPVTWPEDELSETEPRCPACGSDVCLPGPCRYRGSGE